MPDSAFLSPAETAATYDAVAATYAAVRSPQVGRPYADRLCTDLPAGSRVVDIGCGTGLPLTRHLVDGGMRVHGIDLSAGMLDLAGAHVPEATFERADLRSWTSAVAVDGVLAWDALFHLPPEDHLTALAHLCDALRPGGLLLVTVGGCAGTIRSSMLGRDFCYASVGEEAYREGLARANCTVLSAERDQPGEDHLVLFARRECR